MEKDANNRPIQPEHYLDGTHFNELKSLFLFDRELRSLFLKYLLVFENSMKTVIAHEFSKKYPKKNAYLDIANFIDSNPKKVLQQISILTKTIHDKVDKEGAIKHYIEEHGEVPLWVLTNVLTVGNMAHFYQILVPSLQNTIAKFYSDKFNKQYGGNVFRLNVADFEAGLKVVNLVKNTCAHDERLYNTNLKNVRMRPIAEYYGIDHYDNRRLVVLILFLKIVLDKKQFQKFYSSLEKLFTTYRPSFHTVLFHYR